MALLNLFEAETPELLFHVSPPDAAALILKQGKFNLTPAIGSSSELRTQGAGKFYYLSCARTPNSQYVEKEMKGPFPDAMFVLDRRMIKQAYQIKPVDYWGRSWKPDWRTKHENYEAEDRIMSDEPHLSTACVTEVHIVIPGREGHSWGIEKFNKFIEQVKEIVIAADHANITPYVYHDAKRARLRDKRNAIPMDKLEQVLEKAKLHGPFKEYPPYQRSDTVPSYIAYALGVMNASRWEDVPEDVRKRFIWGLPGASSVGSFMADIHNARKREDSLERESINDLIRLMRKLKVRSIPQLLEIVSDRADKLRKEYYSREDNK